MWSLCNQHRITAEEARGHRWLRVGAGARQGGLGPRGCARDLRLRVSPQVGYRRGGCARRQA
ncbi:hypothetical protein BJV78DRAFT_1163381, partial [Lactifluus subvellereus]